MKTIASIIALVGLTSCAGVISGITGQPVPSEPVVTKDGTVINVASQDVYRAKTAPADTVWGLYDAGAVARQTGEVVNSGK